jgi:hypothetical protein
MLQPAALVRVGTRLRARPLLAHSANPAPAFLPGPSTAFPVALGA